MRLTCRIILLATLALPLNAVAACLPDDLQQQIVRHGYQVVLKKLVNSGCLGDVERDTAPLVEQFNELTPDIKTAVPRFKELVAAVDLLANYADKQAAKQVQTDDWRALTNELQNISRQHAKVNASTPKSDLVQIQKALSNKWDIFRQPEPGTEFGTIELHDKKIKLLEINCNIDTKCPDFESRLDMIRVVKLVDRLRGYSQGESLATHYADAQLQTSRWEAYRSQGQHQYIWELWLNGRDMGNLCKRDEGTGIQRGFCKVPESQWIVLHPEAGVRWARSAQRSSELKPAFIVELLGRYSWKWDETNPSSMSNRFGYSLVTAFTNEPTGTKWSYGPMLHFGDGYNIAFTRSSGGAWGLLLNLNLADRYFGRKQEFVDYLKCINKPNFGQLIRGQTCAQNQ